MCKPLEYNTFTFYVPFFLYFFKVCGSMPYDDSNIKKMIKNQLERKLLFSRSKKISAECKDLIRKILEGNVQKRVNLSIINSHHWVRSPDRSTDMEASGSTDRCKTTEAGASSKTSEAEGEATLKTTEPTATLKTTTEAEATLKTTEAEATLKTTEPTATLKATAEAETLKTTTESEATLKPKKEAATLKTRSEAEAVLKLQKQKK